MSHGALLSKWEIAANDLGLDIIAPFDLNIGDGVKVKVNVLVKNFGARNGMMIITSYASIKPYLNQIKSLGYGFSVLEEPIGDEPYDRQAFISMLSDWGWTGTADKKPRWIISFQ